MCDELASRILHLQLAGHDHPIQMLRVGAYLKTSRYLVASRTTKRVTTVARWFLSVAVASTLENSVIESANALRQLFVTHRAIAPPDRGSDRQPPKKTPL